MSQMILRNIKGDADDWGRSRRRRLNDDTKRNDMEIISRSEALARGLKRYFTGKPCKHGHIAERLVSQTNCCECDRLRLLAANMSPEKLERRRERHRIKNLKENMTPESYARLQEHVKRNSHKRRAQMKDELSPGIYQRLYVAQCGQCVYCRISLDEVTPHLDHIMPLALGGSNTDDNVQLLCPTCNIRKGSTHPAEYEARIGYRQPAQAAITTLPPQEYGPLADRGL